MQPALQRFCFDSPPEFIISRELSGVQTRSIVRDGVQVLVWGIGFELVKLLLISQSSETGGIIFRLIYAAVAAELRLIFLLLLQRYENHVRDLYSDYGPGIFGPYRNMAAPDEHDNVRSSLRNSVTNALFNWSNNTTARWCSLLKVVLLCLAALCVRRIIILDSYFILNGIMDLLWLASFWLIVLIEYLHPSPLLLPFLIGLQSVIFK